MTELVGLNGGSSGAALAINAAGEIVGYSYTNTLELRATLWTRK
jgi:probable HAF family extracellular repeat protein